MSNLIAPDDVDFESYFEEQQVDRAKIRPASSWAEDVVGRFYGDGAEKHWVTTGFSKMNGKFDLRPGEVTLWAGINGHGKTTKLSNVMLYVMQRDQRVCLGSFEMKPADSMAKMTRQAAGTGNPTREFIRAFSHWTDDRLWIYDHLGRIPAARVLAVATYVRKELGIDHMVIDSLMKCGVGVDDYTAQRDFVDALCAIARDTGLHIHLVCHMRKGETEKSAPGKFDVKGAGEIADLADNILIIWKNVRKPDDIAAAERKAVEADREAALAEARKQSDSFLRVAKQRHHPWEGSFAFWFDKDSQQFLEAPFAKPQYLDFETGVMR